MLLDNCTIFVFTEIYDQKYFFRIMIKEFHTRTFLATAVLELPKFTFLRFREIVLRIL